MTNGHPATPANPIALTPAVRYNLVSSFYTMLPVVEDMLFSGRDLRVGMKVLIGDSMLRQHLTEKDLNPYELERALTFNRWCTVDRVFVSTSGMVSLMGVYDDGTKIKRTLSADYPWLVKKDSIPKSTMELKLDAHEIAVVKAQRTLEIVRESAERDRSQDVILDMITEVIEHDCAESGCFMDGFSFNHRRTLSKPDPNPTRVDIPVYDGDREIDDQGSSEKADFGPVKSEGISLDEMAKRTGEMIYGPSNEEKNDE